MPTIMETYAVDFETYYDRECSISVLGPRGYFAHPSFDPYLVSVVGDNGFSYVGDPRSFEWRKLEGQRVLSHNASFDESLYLYGVEQGWWPQVIPAEWHCTADMAAACGLPRSLKNATAEAFGLEISKTTRDNMAGKVWENMTKEFRAEVIEYAIKDSELCLRLWQEYSGKWTEFERQISLTNRRLCQRGLPIDSDLVRSNIETINNLLFEAERNIPWAGERPLLSRKAFDEECIKLGIEPPASLAQTDEDAQRWIAIHGHKHKWIESVSNWRRINALKSKLESFDVATMPDGRYYGGLMYFGGHTGRFSGSGGNLNLQNLPREEMFGVNLRYMIRPAEGRKLVVADLSQIEVRTLCWLAEDHATLEEISRTEDIYEAFAIRFGLWSKEQGNLKKNDPDLRHKVKCMVLGCGYGAGAKTFAAISNMDEKEAQKSVDLYRNRLQKIPRYWRDLNDSMQAAYDLQIPFSLSLPSGRSLNYGRTKLTKGTNGHPQHIAVMNRNGKKIPMKLWGGILAENASQALARDIFSYMLLEIDKAGYQIILHVHDEVVVECNAEDAEKVMDHVIQIMSTPPPWISNIPLSSEGSILDRYTK
jgi:DNA polymerase I-like protein with 3'-5' exonuclease and polymerase domains